MTWSVTTHADTPLGWINTNNPAAYTATKGELEISAVTLAVNDTIDFLNYRDDLIAASGRLTGDSGNLQGTRFELNYGLTSDLAIFYRRQQHALTLDLGEFSSIDVADIDNSLDTTTESAGLKWTFYRANLLNPDNRQSAAALELSAFVNSSDNFDVVVNEIRLEDLIISFGIPQTFSVADLEDEGWKAKLIYTWPMDRLGAGTVWAGYGEATATSGTTSDLKSATIRRFFEQSFDTEENYLYLGASLNTDITPRLSANLNYEYISLSDSKFTRFPIEPLPQLPSFLSATGASATDHNHTLSARLAYWLTPQLNLSLIGNLNSNQFVGLLPHYNNPLSGTFSTVPYGFAGLGLTYKFSGIP